MCVTYFRSIVCVGDIINTTKLHTLRHIIYMVMAIDTITHTLIKI